MSVAGNDSTLVTQSVDRQGTEYQEGVFEQRKWGIFAMGVLQKNKSVIGDQGNKPLLGDSTASTATPQLLTTMSGLTPFILQFMGVGVSLQLRCLSFCSSRVTSGISVAHTQTQ